jgi:hypothetical protein
MQILATDAQKNEGIIDADEIACTHCKVKPAEIFQINGEFCLDCWQVITHTNT